jgi:hypothetical protein
MALLTLVRLMVLILAMQHVTSFANALTLEPVFEVSRNADGSFTVEIETHGLGDATVDLVV